MIKMLTTVVMVHSIQEQLPFHKRQLGLTPVMTVPHGGFIGSAKETE